MKLRLVQRGTGPLVLAYLVGPQLDGPLRAVLPGRAIVATTEAVASPFDLETAHAITNVAEGAGVCLIGYSRGCQAVREHLLRGLETRAVVTIDGTHASLPPASWQIDIWAKLAARARRGECTWVATCTQMSYVERLPVGTPGRATSTRHVLEAAIGTDLPPDSEVHSGGLHVFSCRSRDIDHEAHVRQLQDVLPRVLHRHIAAIGSAPRHVPPWRDPTLSLGARAVVWSLEQLGVEEAPAGSSSGPEIRDWLAPCERDGKPLGLTAGNWCAAFACAAQAAALLNGEAPMHPYVASGIELERHFRAVGRWLAAAAARVQRVTLNLGDLALLARGVPGGWQRHVCRVVTPIVDGAFTTIGGNERHGVRLVARRLDDTSLLGFGLLAPVGSASSGSTPAA